MKVLSLILASLIATAAAIPTTPSDHPIPWDQVKNKDATEWTFFAEPKGTDLRKANPTNNCHVDKETGKLPAFMILAGSSDFEFQTLNDGVLGVNCIECSTDQQEDYYQSFNAIYLHCEADGQVLAVDQ